MTSIGKKLLLVIISIIFTLILGEFILQVVYRAKNGVWIWEGNATKYDYVIRTDDRRKYSLRPSFYDPVQNMPINEWGWRETLQPKELSNNDDFIACIGDSVVFGWGIGNEATYPYFLAQILNDDGYPFYVINAGVPSYNLRQSFDRLHLDVYSHLEPKSIKIIIIQAANDVSLLRYYRENWNPDITWADVRFNLSPVPGSNYLATSYYLSQFLSQPQGGSKEITISEMVGKIENILQEELEKLQFVNSEVKVVLLPINPFYYYSKNFEKNENLGQWTVNQQFVTNSSEITADYNLMLNDISNKLNNVYFFDIRKEMDNFERDGLFIDYIHLSEDGNLLQAKLITKFLQENDLMD